MTERIRVWVVKFADRENLMLQWIDPETGRRRSKSARTADEKEAEQARGDLEADLNAGRYAEASRMTWEAFRELFEEEYLPGLRPGTQSVHRNALNLFERLCKPRGLRSITERTISAFAAGLRKLPGRGTKAGMMPSSIQVRLEFLHTALAWAAEQGFIPKVPKFPMIRVPKKKPQPVPAETFERLVAKAPDDQMRAYLLCGWLGGLRLTEAMSLDWEETTEAPYLDLDRDRIVFPAEFVKAAEDQWVPLDPVLRAALEALPRSGRKVFRFVAGDGHPIQPVSLSRRVVILAKQAGVKLSMKSLRRGFGCYYAARVPAQVLQKLMRHSNIAVTTTYYSNVDSAVEEAVRDRQRNSQRNTPGTEVPGVNASSDTTLDAAKPTGDAES